MPPLYGLTTQTAGDLKRLISHGDQLGATGTPGAAARGVTWVKVTGEPDDDGWYPAAVSIDAAGVWEDGTEGVLVRPADDNPLETDGTHRYLCTRTGDNADDVARFRTLEGRRTVEFHRYRYTCGDGNLSEEDTTIRITGYGLTIEEV